MKPLKILKQNRNFAILTIILIVLSVFSIYKFGFNAGVDFADSTILSFVSDKTSVELDSSISKVKAPARIERLGTNEIRVYFQNVSSEQLTQIKETLKTDLGLEAEYAQYIYTPSQIYALKDRALAGGLVIILVTIAYYLYAFRGAGLTLGRALLVVVSEGLTNGVYLLMLGGIVSLVGYLGVAIDYTLLAILIFALLLFNLIQVFMLFRAKSFMLKNPKYSLVELWQELNLKDWPTTVFVATLFAIAFVLPLLALSKVFAAAILIWGYALVAGLITALISRMKIFEFFAFLGTKSKIINKISIFKRKW